jgi:hypothetical protein
VVENTLTFRRRARTDVPVVATIVHRSLDRDARRDAELLGGYLGVDAPGVFAALRNASDRARPLQKESMRVGDPCGADPPAALPRSARHDRRGTNRQMINDPLDAGSC